MQIWVSDVPSLPPFILIGMVSGILTQHWITIQQYLNRNNALRHINIRIGEKKGVWNLISIPETVYPTEVTCTVPSVPSLDFSGQHARMTSRWIKDSQVSKSTCLRRCENAKRNPPISAKLYPGPSNQEALLLDNYSMPGAKGRPSKQRVGNEEQQAAVQQGAHSNPHKAKRNWIKGTSRGFLGSLQLPSCSPTPQLLK